jgi:ABC-type multidrug transport system fused ATPase/permease subunit
VEDKQRRKGLNLKGGKAVFRFLIPYRSSFFLGLLLLFLSSLTTLVVPRLMGQLAGIGLADEGSTSTWELAGMTWDLMDLRTVALMLFVVFALQGVISFCKVYVFSFVSESMIRDLRIELFEHLIRLPMAFFDEERVGDLNSRISADIATIQETFTTTLGEFIRQIIVILLGLTFLLYISPDLTLVMLATFPVMVIVAVFFGRFIKNLSKRTQDSVGESNVVVQESLVGVVSVKAFTNEDYESSRYGRAVDVARSLALKSAFWRGLFSAFIIIFLFGSIAIVIGKGAMLLQSGDLEPALFFSFLLYTVMIGASFGGIASQYAAIQKAVGSVERVFEILDSPEERGKDDRTDMSDFNGDIEFRDVRFTYPTRPDVEVLKGVDMHIERGMQVAVVGRSGGGKSTLAALVMRLYQPDSGQLLFDGQPGSQWSLSSLRSRMAYVPQEIILFAGTIRDNIAYGKPDADEAEILQAAENAQVMEFVDRFEDGLDTLVGDRGVQLSGGQKQRIAIARAWLKDPALLILDEATSSLDSTSENLVQKALDRLMKGRTSIVIAHRLSTIRKSDRIYVMENGQVIEEGTHDDLIAEEGAYHTLRQLQADGEVYS